MVSKFHKMSKHRALAKGQYRYISCFYRMTERIGDIIQSIISITSKEC